MNNKEYNKHYIADYIWQYSRHYGQLLFDSEELFSSGKGHTALITLFNVLEHILKSINGNYEEDFKKVLTRLKKESFINNIEYNFLSKNKYSVRKIRNLFAHADLSPYHYIDDNGIYYSFTENETALLIYSQLSPVIFNLILKVLSTKLDINHKINTLTPGNNFNINISKLSTKEHATK